MNLLATIRTKPPQKAVLGYTLIEVLTSAVILSLVTLAMVSVQLFGLRAYTLAATKLSATAGGMKTLNTIRDQIRSGEDVDVGNYTRASGSFANFNSISNGLAQKGNALRISPTNNFLSSTPYTLFYLQPGGADFTSGTNSLIMVTLSNNAILYSNQLATYITNQYVFQAQDFQNNVLSNNANNRVIQVQLNFSQWEYPIGIIGTNGFDAYDFYQIRTRVTRRNIN